ncbi:thioredoxin domain-containing protein [Pelagicoccus sp. SDUM812003]|uniref:thioredoxin domain-containing protein n=1 Tax=Pelagicoccus sp. SDUM812003 TaxID=3041267 RepID=UPI00280E702B|nr:thioredoxin domain-containing protein [Pelagicoccus sp. SDUM812003]MDQ8204426.1 thioredoxin domain-containing protein [Pelagicoccus sp. SDUM812003]
MFRRLSLFLSALLPTAAHSAVENVDAPRFSELAQDENAIVVDVRTPQEIAQGKVPNASEIDFYDPNFAAKASRLQKDKTILLYCRSGARSSQAAQQLNSMGFANIVNLNGGITAWQRAKLPIEVPDTVAASDAPQPISQEEFETAIAANPYVLLNFNSKWCSPCRRMKPVIQELEEKHADQIKVLEIDADANEALMDQYEVTPVPTFVILNKGQEIWRKTGATPLQAFLDAIE